jgi:hypothetical protein
MRFLEKVTQSSKKIPTIWTPGVIQIQRYPHHPWVPAYTGKLTGAPIFSAYDFHIQSKVFTFGGISDNFGRERRMCLNKPKKTENDRISCGLRKKLHQWCFLELSQKEGIFSIPE